MLKPNGSGPNPTLRLEIGPVSPTMIVFAFSTADDG